MTRPSTQLSDSYSSGDVYVYVSCSCVDVWPMCGQCVAWFGAGWCGVGCGAVGAWGLDVVGAYARGRAPHKTPERSASGLCASHVREPRGPTDGPLDIVRRGWGAVCRVRLRTAQARERSVFTCFRSPSASPQDRAESGESGAQSGVCVERRCGEAVSTSSKLPSVTRNHVMFSFLFFLAFFITDGAVTAWGSGDWSSVAAA